ncbi:unnamed protein product [Timema podura]|uniref:Uncharacterized protein n=1 Tax=Timema podura TaxID=61482 RepID=A0ABN7PIA3_TIMPD|nr:unnamed protein product [Timema podura]
MLMWDYNNADPMHAPRLGTNYIDSSLYDEAARRSQIGASYLKTDLSTESSTGIITVETWPTSKDYGVRERGFVGVRYKRTLSGGEVQGIV